MKKEPDSLFNTCYFKSAKTFWYSLLYKELQGSSVLSL